MIKTELFKNDNFEEFCMACKTSFAIKLSEKKYKTVYTISFQYNYKKRHSYKFT